MLNLLEVKKRIQSEKDWQSRCRDIDIFHSQLNLTRKKWSIRKTAKLLKMCASTVCEDLQLAAFLVNDTSIEKFRRRKDALEYIRND
jgi:hypothetical protein